MLGMLMQRFEFVDHANYQLKIKESLTLKPDGSDDHDPPPQRTDLGLGAAAGGGRRQAADPGAGRRAGRPPRHAAAGALRLQPRRVGGPRHADRAATRPTGATRPAPPALDDAVGELPTEGAVVVVTSSYNGQPPDNAGRFCTWVDDAASSAAGVRYTVFGCGNRDWAATYQAVPTRVDAGLEARGATRVYPRGEGDARGDFDAQFEAWYAGLWDALGVGPGAGRLDDGGGRERPAAGRGARAAPHGEPGPAVLPRPGRDRAGQPRAHRPRGHPGRPLGAAPGDHAARRHVLRRGRPPRGAAAQRRVGGQPGARPLRPGRGPVRHAHRDRRHPDPPARRRALPAAGHPGRLRRAAGRREPRRPGGDGGPHAGGPRPRRARGPGRDRRRARRPATGRRSRSRGARCSTCSRTTPSATCPSRSSSTGCRRCARATTRSPRRRR